MDTVAVARQATPACDQTASTHPLIHDPPFDRASGLRQYAMSAGFRSVTILPIEHDLWRFYRPDA